MTWLLGRVTGDASDFSEPPTDFFTEFFQSPRIRAGDQPLVFVIDDGVVPVILLRIKWAIRECETGVVQINPNVDDASGLCSGWKGVATDQNLWTMTDR